VQKTQSLLHEALMSLIDDKSYDSIVVNEILDRANVGRSTFYAHFRNKDDLLVSGIYDALHSGDSTGRLASANGAERLVWFSLPILRHIDRHRQAAQRKMSANEWATIHERLQQAVVHVIAEDVQKRLRPQTSVLQIPPDLVIRHVASTFVLVLNWWLEDRSALAPEDVDEMFRALVLPTLAVHFD
jgi:AcrR family transcriptional regulator